MLYSEERRTALSQPAFEQYPFRVRADRPISALIGAYREPSCNPSPGATAQTGAVGRL